MIENNTEQGIVIDRSAAASIGTNGLSNSIQYNAGGVQVRRSSAARILAAVISNNAGIGVQISQASQADVGNNTIDANSGDGIRVQENSGLNLVTPANTGSNGQFGIRCRIGGYATGSIGALTGTSGQKSFGTTLTLSLVGGANSTWGEIEGGDGSALTVTGDGTVSINSEGCIDRTSP